MKAFKDYSHISVSMEVPCVSDNIVSELSQTKKFHTFSSYLFTHVWARIIEKMCQCLFSVYPVIFIYPILITLKEFVFYVRSF